MEAALVECRSDYTYAQRPTAIYWQGVRLPVEKVLLEWRSPEGKGFQVLTTSGEVFNLHYDQEAQTWHARLQ